jgi:hypothetical protein
MLCPVLLFLTGVAKKMAVKTHNKKNSSNMKNTIIGSLLFGAVVFAAANVNAQNISDKLTVSGVLTWQTANTTNAAGTVATWHTKSAAFNNKSIIALLNASSAFTTANAANPVSTTIPAGSWLTFDGTSVWATNKSGFSANLTALLDGATTPQPFATISINGSSVTVGHYTIDPTKGGGNEEDSDANITATIQDGNGTSVTISGLGSEQSVWSKTGTTGHFHQTQSFDVSGGGSASHVGNANAVSKGVVTGSGSGTL